MLGSGSSNKSGLAVCSDSLRNEIVPVILASGEVYLSSHAVLIAHALGDHESTLKTWIMSHKDYVSPGGKALPALVTPFDCAREVFANCYLSVVDSEVSHRRFFPREPLGRLSVEEACEIFIEEVRFNVRAWLAVTDRSYFALTAGLDSRAVFASSLDLLQESENDVTAMTYHFFERGNKNTVEDLFKANELALNAGINFKIVDVIQLEPGTPMANLYRETFPTWARFPSLCTSFYTQLSHDSSLFIGIGGEIGTVFYAQRDQDQITPEILAKKYAYSAVSDDPRLVGMFEEYIDYVEFHQSKLFNYDFYDLFYWEHRMSKWAAIGYAEYDLSTTVALPMNSRKLIQAMLSLDLEDRKKKAIYREIERISFVF